LLNDILKTRKKLECNECIFICSKCSSYLISDFRCKTNYKVIIALCYDCMITNKPKTYEVIYHDIYGNIVKFEKFNYIIDYEYRLFDEDES